MQTSAPIALAAGHLQTVDPVDPARHAIIYNARLAPSAKWIQCLPAGAMLGPHATLGLATCSSCCNLLNWDKLDARSYVRVYENRIDTNVATTCCFGLAVCDNPSTVYFDKSPESLKVETCCTPYHVCCIIECGGGVVAMAPWAGCNNCFCGQFRTFYGGVNKPAEFINAITSARDVFRQNARLPAGALLTAPVIVQMA